MNAKPHTFGVEIIEHFRQEVTLEKAAVQLIKRLRGPNLGIEVEVTQKGRDPVAYLVQTDSDNPDLDALYLPGYRLLRGKRKDLFGISVAMDLPLDESDDPCDTPIDAALRFVELLREPVKYTSVPSEWCVTNLDDPNKTVYVNIYKSGGIVARDHWNKPTIVNEPWHP